MGAASASPVGPTTTQRGGHARAAGRWLRSSTTRSAGAATSRRSCGAPSAASTRESVPTSRAVPSARRVRRSRQHRVLRAGFRRRRWRPLAMPSAPAAGAARQHRARCVLRSPSDVSATARHAVPTATSVPSAPAGGADACGRSFGWPGTMTQISVASAGGDRSWSVSGAVGSATAAANAKASCSARRAARHGPRSARIAAGSVTWRHSGRRGPFVPSATTGRWPRRRTVPPAATTGASAAIPGSTSTSAPTAPVSPSRTTAAFAVLRTASTSAGVAPAASSSDVLPSCSVPRRPVGGMGSSRSTRRLSPPPTLGRSWTGS